MHFFGYLYHTICTIGTSSIYSLENNKMTLLPTKQKTKNTVSKKGNKKGYKPLIDIRSKKALETFKNATHLKIEVYKDKIYIEGLKEDCTEHVVQTNKVSSSNISNTKVIKIKHKLKSVKNCKYVINKKAVGAEQYSLFDEIIEEGNRFEYSSTNFLERLKKKVPGKQLSLFGDIEKEKEKEDNRKSKIINFAEVRKKLQTSMSVVSLFSGAGLLDFAFKEEGFDIQWALDYEKGCVETYRHNIGKHIHHRDILDVDIEEIPDTDGIICGTPCDKLSRVNRKDNICKEDNEQGLLDHKLLKPLKKTLEIIKSKKFKWFAMENVTQLITVHGGQLYAEIKKHLSNYKIKHFKVNACDYGSAQSRDRVFIVGTTTGQIPEFLEPTHGKNNFKTVKEAFRGLTNDVANQLDYSKPKESTINKMKLIKQGENQQVLPKEMRTGSFKNSMYRLHEDGLSPSIVNVRKSTITHPIENRILSVRECARLFDLPDSFTFKGTLGSMQQQCCQGVPLSIGRGLAKSIKKLLSSSQDTAAVY